MRWALGPTPPPPPPLPPRLLPLPWRIAPALPGRAFVDRLVASFAALGRDPATLIIAFVSSIAIQLLLVGLAWGLAEEAGKAAGWLAARHLPGAETFTTLLTRFDGVAYADRAPAGQALTESDVQWQTAGGPDQPLCPLVSGVCLSDFGITQARLGTLACPLILLPFVHQVSVRTGITLMLLQAISELFKDILRLAGQDMGEKT